MNPGSRVSKNRVSCLEPALGSFGLCSWKCGWVSKMTQGEALLLPATRSAENAGPPAAEGRMQGGARAAEVPLCLSHGRARAACGVGHCNLLIMYP